MAAKLVAHDGPHELASASYVAAGIDAHSFPKLFDESPPGSAGNAKRVLVVASCASGASYLTRISGAVEMVPIGLILPRIRAQPTRLWLQMSRVRAPSVTQ
jgi:hypothetical protein